MSSSVLPSRIMSLRTRFTACSRTFCLMKGLVRYLCNLGLNLTLFVFWIVFFSSLFHSFSLFSSLFLAFPRFSSLFLAFLRFSSLFFVISTQSISSRCGVASMPDLQSPFADFGTAVMAFCEILAHRLLDKRYSCPTLYSLLPTPYSLLSTI